MALSSLEKKLTRQSLSNCFKIVWLVRRDGQVSHPEEGDYRRVYEVKMVIIDQFGLNNF